MINPNLTEAKELAQEQNAQTERTQLQELQEQLAVLRKQNDQYRSRIQEQDKTMESLANAELAQGNNSGSLLDEELKELRGEVEELTHLEAKRKEAAELRKRVNSMREKDKAGIYKPPIYTLDRLPNDEDAVKTLIYKHALTQLQENRPEVDPQGTRIKERLKRYTNAMYKAIAIKRDPSVAVHKDLLVKQQMNQAQSTAAIELKIKPIVSARDFGCEPIQF